MKNDLKRIKDTFAPMKTKNTKMEEEDSYSTDSDIESISLFLQMGSKLLLEIVTKWEGKNFLRSALMEGNITVRTMSLYWIKERGHRRLGVPLTSLGKI